MIIAGAGGAAHLPGMTASMTPLPVIGVPVPREKLDGLDSLLSIVQMPPGIPVATVGIGEARNAGLLAVRILAATNPELRRQMESFQSELAEAVREKDDGGPQAVRVDRSLVGDGLEHVELGGAAGGADGGDHTGDPADDRDDRELPTRRRELGDPLVGERLDDGPAEEQADH